MPSLILSPALGEGGGGVLGTPSTTKKKSLFSYKEIIKRKKYVPLMPGGIEPLIKRNYLNVLSLYF